MVADKSQRQSTYDQSLLDYEAFLLIPLGYTHFGAPAMCLTDQPLKLGKRMCSATAIGHSFAFRS